jgi:hypothetical protein
MQGWRVTLKDGTQVMRAEPMVLPTSAAAGDAGKRDVEERMEEEGEKEKDKEKEEEEEEEGEEEDEEKDDEG